MRFDGVKHFQQMYNTSAAELIVRHFHGYKGYTGYMALGGIRRIHWNALLTQGPCVCGEFYAGDRRDIPDTRDRRDTRDTRDTGQTRDTRDCT